MTKLYKVEMYIIDYDEQHENLESVIRDMQFGSDLNINGFNGEVVDVEWHDDIDINYWKCPVENFRKYFEKEKC